MKSKLTVDTVKMIAEELRVTRYKATGQMAFDYIWDKYKDLFVCYDQFLKLMDICSVFFSCRPDVEEIRRRTTYIYV